MPTAWQSVDFITLLSFVTQILFFTFFDNTFEVIRSCLDLVGFY